MYLREVGERFNANDLNSSELAGKIVKPRLKNESKHSIKKELDANSLPSMNDIFILTILENVCVRFVD